MKIIKFLLTTAFLFGAIVLFKPQTVDASTAVIDSYIKVNSVTKNNNGSITVKYTMKQSFNQKPYGNITQSLQISYAMHSALKVKNNSFQVKTKPGNYTLTLPAPKPNFLGSQKVQVKWGMQGRTETKNIKTVYNVPSNYLKINHSIHTVTKTEAVAGHIVLNYLPGITAAFVFKGSTATVKEMTKKGASAFVGVTGLNLSVGQYKQMPAPTTGQIYYTESKIDKNGLIHKKLLIFANKATYDVFKQSNYKKSNLAIYNTSSKTRLSY